MKKFIIEICRTTGEYEAHHKKLLEARDKKSAERKALRGELHYSEKEFGFNYMNDGFFWVNPDTIAKVCDIREIPADDFTVLQKYL